VPDSTKPKIAGRQRVGGAGDPEVFCADEQDEVPVDLLRWQQFALDVLIAERVRGLAELSLLFVAEAEITELNERYMGVAGPTDVLSFPLDAADAEEVLQSPAANIGPDRSPPDLGDMPLLLGDVVICPKVAERQFADHAGTLDDEIALLVVHGVLHVLVFDHAEPAERDTMRAREVELLQAHHWHGPTPSGFHQEQPD
jgi:probable rRNA maturation factor